MPHFESLYPNRFLKGATLERPLTVRIVSVDGEMLEGDTGPKAKAVLKYKTQDASGAVVGGELVLAKTNAVLIASMLGPDYKQWAGHLITVSFDPAVMFGSERVGGIRVIGSPELTKTLVVEVKRPRRKRPEKYTLQPTDKRGAVIAPAQEPEPKAEAARGEEAK